MSWNDQWLFEITRPNPYTSMLDLFVYFNQWGVSQNLYQFLTDSMFASSGDGRSRPVPDPEMTHNHWTQDVWHHRKCWFNLNNTTQKVQSNSTWTHRDTSLLNPFFHRHLCVHPGRGPVPSAAVRAAGYRWDVTSTSICWWIFYVLFSLTQTQYQRRAVEPCHGKWQGFLWGRTFHCLR